MRPLPPLNALRAFEATARHLSFSKAAEELHVTPAALSHQIRGLEDLLGLKLFHRHTRSIALTEPARLIYPGIRTGFEAIREAVDRLGRGRHDRILVVSSTPGFTAKWLVPRLYRFLERHPDIETRISASVAYANFTSDGVDVGIRLSSGVHPELHIEKLSDEWLLPLCSPRLLNGEHSLRSPRDLAHFPLIQVDLPGVVPTWADWLGMAGIEGIDSTRGLRLNVADHALDAASEGMGIVLAYKMVAARDILLKRLVAPFGPEIPVPGRAYYFVCARGQEKRAPVKAFRDWVFAEMEETHASLAAALAQPPEPGEDPQGLSPYARAIHREAPASSQPSDASKPARRRATPRSRASAARPGVGSD